MLIVLGGLAQFERDLICTRTSEGRVPAVACGQNGPTVQADRSPETRGDQAPRAGRNPCGSYNVSPATISRLAP